MVLLPLAYLGLIGALAWVVWWHATENVTLLRTSGWGGHRLRFAAYVAPIFVGAVLVVFLLKPLFAPRPRSPRPLALQRDDEPLLFAFVDKLCDAVGAPRPSQIHVDCELNASAGFHTGADLVRGGRVLTIGMPMVAGLTLAQFAGVLAHEFGHFAQGTGTRLSSVIHSINCWFWRVVHERDAWDARLERMAQFPGLTSLTAGVARGCVWLTRRVLLGLLWMARMVSSYLSRQMELDADRYETALVGSAGAESVLRRTAVLDPLWQHTLQQSWSGWPQRRLPADLPAFLRCHDAGLQDAVRQQLQASIEHEPKELFSTHPRGVERIAAARAAACEARFASDGPASLLFRDFAAVAREVTRRYWEEALGDELRPEYLLDPDALWAAHAQQGADQAVLQRYCQNMASWAVPLRLAATPPMEAGEALRARLAALRESVVAEAEAQDTACAAAVAAIVARDNAEVAGVLRRAEIRLDPSAFGLDGSDLAAVNAARRRAEADLQAQLTEARRRQAPLEERWSLCLGWLARDDRPAELAALASESQRLLHLLAELRGHESRIDALRAGQCVLDALLHNLSSAPSNDSLRSQTCERGVRLAGETRQLLARLDALPYPFPYEKSPLSIAAHAALSCPATPDPIHTSTAARRLLQTVDDTHHRCLARLAVAAEAAETALGLPPLSSNP